MRPDVFIIADESRKFENRFKIDQNLMIARSVSILKKQINLEMSI